MLLIGQDPIFSQYYSAPLQLNPAFAGNTHAPKFSINYRNQWPAVSKAYTTYSVSYDQYFNDLNSGFGLYVLADDAGNGLFKTNKLGGIYSYRLRVKDDIFAKFASKQPLFKQDIIGTNLSSRINYPMRGRLLQEALL